MSTRGRLVATLALAIAIWTVVLLAALVFFVPGQVAPCPEAARVGLSDQEREALLRACASGMPIDRGFVAGVVIWLAGTSLLLVIGARLGRRSRPPA